MTETEFKLSLQRALLGNVPSCLRSASGQIKGTVLSVRFITDGILSDRAHDALTSAMAEIAADLYSDWSLEEDFCRLDGPACFRSLSLEIAVYERFEPVP